MEKITEKEKKFHNFRFKFDTRKKLDKYYSITAKANEFFFHQINSNVKSLHMLDFGCGEGHNSIQLLKTNLTAKLFGIDISEVAIKNAKQKLLIADKFGTNIFLLVMNAEQIGFKGRQFYKIFGSAILHHLDLQNALSEINRLLLPNGEAIFLEPLGHNIFINLFRKLTPKLRSEDEHPLCEKDLLLFNKYFEQVDLKYFNLTTMFSLPFRNTFIFPKIFNFLDKIDSILFKFRFFQRNAWIVIINLSKPKELKTN